MQCSIPNTFQNGTGEANIIDAPKMNENFNHIATILNGNIEKGNIKTGSAILVGDRDYLGANKITGSFEFNAFPTVPDQSIPDAKLSTNIPHKDGANTFAVKQTFSLGVDCNKKEAQNFKVEDVASLPEWTATDKGRLVKVAAGNVYVGGNSAWIRIDYVGGYTGGAIRSYAHTGIVDDGNSLKFLFKTDGVSPTVKVFLKGEPFPSRFYTELGEHDHDFAGIAHNHGITDSGHTHITTIGSHGHGTTQYGIGSHTHPVSGNTGNQNINHVHSITNHYHIGVTSNGQNTGGLSFTVNTGGDIGNHHHAMNFTSGVASAKQQIESTNIGNKTSNNSATGISVNDATAGGTVAKKGVNGGTLSTSQKLYAKYLTVKIDNTEITSNIKTATGWANIGDGLGTHAFHTDGTGELDASSWMSYSEGFHTLEVIEPEGGFGSSILIHLEAS